MASAINDATWRAIECFNRIVEHACEDLSDANDALKLLRAHLDERIEQTRALEALPRLEDLV